MSAGPAAREFIRAIGRNDPLIADLQIANRAISRLQFGMISRLLVVCAFSSAFLSTWPR